MILVKNILDIGWVFVGLIKIIFCFIIWLECNYLKIVYMLIKWVGLFVVWVICVIFFLKKVYLFVIIKR